MNMEYILVLILGAAIGSFLNVCIYRIPLSKSIVWPGSFCPFCEHPIKWFHNIPLVSFLLLRGKCAYCSRPIAVRYFIVELFTALIGAGLLAHFGMEPSFFVYWAFTCALIVVVGIDIEYQQIPDVISLPGIVAGAVLVTALRLDGSGTYGLALLNSGLGILAGGGSMFLLGVVGELIYKKEALGGGDVKLMAMIGAFIGWKLVLVTFFLAPVLGSGVGIFMKIRFHKEVIAYGPYLSLAAFISLLYGDNIIGYLFGF